MNTNHVGHGHLSTILTRFLFRPALSVSIVGIVQRGIVITLVELLHGVLGMYVLQCSNNSKSPEFGERPNSHHGTFDFIPRGNYIVAFKQEQLRFMKDLQRGTHDKKKPP